MESIASARNVSVAALSNILQKHNKHVHKELDEYCDIITPYGKLIMFKALALKDGTEPYQWPIVNPFALLHVMCRKPAGFGMCLKKYVACGVSGIVLYTDETCAGNPLRPDQRGDVQCFYWTFSDFPDWYRSRRYGWFAFGFLDVAMQHRTKGDISSICKHMVLQFFNPKSFNFEFGVHLPHGKEKIVLKATLKCFLQDGKTFKELNCTKGGEVGIIARSARMLSIRHQI